MKMLCAMAVLLVFWPSQASAQTPIADAARTMPVENIHRLLTIAAIGQAADVATSCWLFRTGDFREGNHLLPTSCWKIAAIKGAVFVTADLLTHRLERRGNPKLAKRVARVLAIGSWVPVVWNSAQIVRYSKRKRAAG